MSREIETVTKMVEQTNDTIKSTTCDICGTTVEGRFESQPRDRLGDHDEIIVQLKHGCSYPGTGDYEYADYDVCPKCFREVLAPWIESHRGAKPRTYKVSW